MTPTLIIRDPFDKALLPHKIHRHIPEQPPGAQWDSFVDNLHAAGPEGIPPIVISTITEQCPHNFIMDGIRRWQAAKQMQWPRILCVEAPEDLAGTIMLESLFGQRDLSRGAKVYIALGMLKEFVDSAESRRLANLQRDKGKKTQEPLILSKDSNCPSGTISELCARWGIAAETYKRAREVRILFDKHPAHRAVWEPKLLSGEKNLWNVISGMAGGAPKHQENAKADQMFLNGFDAFVSGNIFYRPMLRKVIERIEDVTELDKLTELAGDIVKLVDTRRSKLSEGGKA